MCEPRPGYIISQDFLNYLLNASEESQVCADVVVPALILPPPMQEPYGASEGGMGFWSGVGVGAGIGAGVTLLTILGLVLATSGT